MIGNLPEMAKFGKNEIHLGALSRGNSYALDLLKSSFYWAIMLNKAVFYKREPSQVSSLSNQVY